VIDSSRVVRAGNGTLAAAQQLGWTHIDCVISDLSAADLVSYAIADNRTSELADWDLDLLIPQLEALPDDLAVATGFSAEDLQALIDGQDGDIDAAIGGGVDYQPVFQVMIDCAGEVKQREVFEKLTGMGYTCKCQQV
jgi:hypothetical protein